MNHALIFAAVEAVKNLKGLESKDKHTQSVTHNVIGYVLKDLQLLAHEYRIEMSEFLEALR